LPPRPDRFWGSPSRLPNGYRGFFLWGKAVGVKNAWSYNSIPPYIIMAWFLLKHRDSYLFWNVKNKRGITDRHTDQPKNFLLIYYQDMYKLYSVALWKKI